jgi:lincosamide nucleotidyltransferase A/C/D/E
MVRAKDVIEIVERLSAAGIRTWICGGWGIDALLGRRTRPHKDLDILVLLDDIVRARELLECDGYKLGCSGGERRLAPRVAGENA